MTTGESGRDHDPRPPVYMPDALAVARMVAIRSGNANMHPGRYLWEGMASLDASFQVSDKESHSGTAVIRLLYQEHGDPVHREKLTDRRLIEAPIGHYLPGTDQWVLYQEYMPPDNDQQSRLREHLDIVSKARDAVGLMSVQVGDPFVELRNPATTDMRRRTSALLQVLGLDTNLITRFPYLQPDSVPYFKKGIVTVGHDESTSAYMVISGQPLPSSPADEFETLQETPGTAAISAAPLHNTLSVVHQGAILSQGDHSIRGDYTVQIARQAGNGKWQPAPGILSMQEWAAVRAVPADFMIAKQANPDFMADRCAVGNNITDSYVAVI